LNYIKPLSILQNYYIMLNLICQVFGKNFFIFAKKFFSQTLTNDFSCVIIILPLI